MEKLFSGMLLASDLDGTLLDSKKQISPENREAIRYFREEGGSFVVATGRAIQSAMPYLEQLACRLPAILYNGSALYDYRTNEVLWSVTLPSGIREDVRRIMAAFPQVGVEILSGEDFFVPQDHAVLVQQRELFENVTMILCPLSEVPEHWYKVLFGMNPADMEKFKIGVQNMGCNGVYFTQSSDVYYEMLPQSASKGAALRALAERFGFRREKIVAIGDQENDIDMLRYAGIGYAVANALPKVRQVADRVTRSNDESAVAAVVAELAKTVKQKGR